MSMVPSALDHVVGYRGAPLTLGAMLIIHVPPLALLTYVFQAEREVHVLRPTDW